MILCIITNFSLILLRNEFYFIPIFSGIYIGIVPPIPLLLTLLVFAFIPAIYPTPKFFKKRGFVNVIIEYQYLKKILYISIFILITLIGFYYFSDIIVNDLSPKVVQQDDH